MVVEAHATPCAWRRILDEMLLEFQCAENINKLMGTVDKQIGIAVTYDILRYSLDPQILKRDLVSADNIPSVFRILEQS